MVQQPPGNEPIASEASEIRRGAADLAEDARLRSEALAVAYADFVQAGAAVMAASGDAGRLAEQAASQAGDAAAARASLTAARNQLNAASARMDALVSAAGKVVAAAKVSDPKDEWEECRKTIDRFDKILVDLRKNAFGVIGTVLSAAALLFGSTVGTGASALSSARA